MAFFRIGYFGGVFNLAYQKCNNYVLLSIGGKVGADNNGGDGGSAYNGVGGGGGGGCTSVQFPHCMTVTPMHSFHSFSQTDAR